MSESLSCILAKKAFCRPSCSRASSSACAMRVTESPSFRCKLSVSHCRSSRAAAVLCNRRSKSRHLPSDCDRQDSIAMASRAAASCRVPAMLIDDEMSRLISLSPCTSCLAMDSRARVRSRKLSSTVVCNVSTCALIRSISISNFSCTLATAARDSASPGSTTMTSVCTSFSNAASASVSAPSTEITRSCEESGPSDSMPRSC